MSTPPADPLLARLRAVTAKYDDGDGEGEALAQAARDAVRRRLRTGGKRCASCGEDKPLSAFGAHSGRRDGLQAWCRDCR